MTSARAAAPGGRPSRDVRLRVLHVEDSDDDARLIERELRRGDYEIVYRRVQSEGAMEAALAEGAWDLVLADYALPGFSGMAALALVQAHRQDAPFIIVSGEIGEEIAVAAMKAGAHDYVMKHNLPRLLPAIERELREAATRSARRQAETALMERARLAAMAADIGAALARGGSSRAVLDECAAAIVRHLGVAHVGLWTGAGADGVLELQASAGVDSAGGDGHGPVGAAEVAAIAAERRPYLTDSVVGDARLGNQEWLQREGIAAFAGYPLVVEDQVVGVLVLFARAPLGEVAARTLASVADEIAIDTQRRRAETETRQSEARFRSLIEHASDLIAVVDAEGVMRYVSPSHERILGYAQADLTGRSAFDLIHPDDRDKVASLFRRGAAEARSGGGMEFRFRHAEGSWRVIEGVGRNLLDDPSVAGLVINSWDVTERKRAEEKTAALLRVAHDVSGTLDLAEILERVQATIARVLPCDAVGTLSLAAPDRFRVEAQHGIPADLVDSVLAMTIPRALLFQAQLDRGETVVVNDFAVAGQPDRDLAERFRVAAAVTAPLASGGRTMGALIAVRRPGSAPFDAAEVDLCAAIAREVGLAMRAVELYRRQEEDARIATALASVGRELIVSLDTASVLERLCRVGSEALECDAGWTLLRQEDGSFQGIAAHGLGSEAWAELQSLRLPASVFEPLLPRLLEEQVEQSAAGESSGWALIAARFGVARVLCVPLLRAGEVTGLQCAGRRHPGDAAFTAPQERIARGIAQIASLALENTRLFEASERANRIKSEFLASMSHELRTPLNVILGYDELLADGAFGPLNEEQGDILGRMYKSGQHLLDLISTMLDIGRLASGRVAVEMEDVDLRELLAELRDDASAHEEVRPLRFVWRIADDLPAIHTDRLKLKAILRNLLDNAVKFTDVGSVTITAARDGDRIGISIADTGIGIATEALPIIFEPFRQSSAALRRAAGGVGLGLYIVRQFADLLGATIAVTSEVDHGSTFRLSLPL